MVEPSAGVRRVSQLVPGLCHHEALQTLQVPGTRVLAAPAASSVDDECGVAVDLGMGGKKKKKNSINVGQDTF